MPDERATADSTDTTNANQPSGNNPAVQPHYQGMSPAAKFLLGGIAAIGSVCMFTAAMRHIPVGFCNTNSSLGSVVASEKVPAKQSPIKPRSNGVYSIDNDYQIRFRDGVVWPCERNDRDIATEFARQADSQIACLPGTNTNNSHARFLRSTYGPEVIKKGYLSRGDVGLQPKPVEPVQPTPGRCTIHKTRGD